jgi:hypothetical protein
MGTGRCGGSDGSYRGWDPKEGEGLIAVFPDRRPGCRVIEAVDTTLSTHAAALEYLARGWSVVAIVPGEKRPALGWQVYQHRLPTEDEVNGWFRDQPDANIATVTGALSIRPS